MPPTTIYPVAVPRRYEPDESVLEEAPPSSDTPVSGVHVIVSGDRFVDSGRRAFLDDPIDAPTVSRLFAEDARAAMTPPLQAGRQYEYYLHYIGEYRQDGRVEDLIAGFESLLRAADAVAGIQVFRKGTWSEERAFDALRAQLRLYERCVELADEALDELSKPENVEVGDDRAWEIEETRDQRVLPQIESITQLLRRRRGTGSGNGGNAAPGGGCLPPALGSGGVAAASPMLDDASAMVAGVAVTYGAPAVSPAYLAGAMLAAAPCPVAL